MHRFSSIKEIKGVGEKTEKLFAKLGIFQVEDLIRYFPRNYDTFLEPCTIASLIPGEKYAVEGVICEAVQIRKVRNLQIVTTTIRDNTGILKLTWFNMPFLRTILKKGSKFVFRGEVTGKQNVLIMEQPKYYSPEDYRKLLNTMQPVYGLTAGLTNHTVSRCVSKVLEEPEPSLLEEFFPKSIKEKYQLMDYEDAIRKIHFPKNFEELKDARRRLVFEEFFFFSLALQSLQESREMAKNTFVIKETKYTEQIIRNLPFALTDAQVKVFEEIQKDMQKEIAMTRLIQGDVGSGKSIVAVLALVLAAANGYQGAMMAPTEVLAKQHLQTIEKIIKENQLPFSAALLTGATKAKEKKEIYSRLEDGSLQLVVGTHALIQEKVQYKNLALVITDEQHRFGVNQRKGLSEKGSHPHILVMSATPIPRTLAVILYGDLDISVIDQMPAERLPIKNCVVDTSYRPNAYKFMEKEIAKGHQVYVICAMVEDSENVEAENVVAYTAALQSQLSPGITVEYLHGKMKSDEKNQIMERFSRNEIQVLVSTTVIEVGINVPNATVMMIENAERFGLAQLHQLRGRVGRGPDQSYCIMVHGNEEEKTRQRLEILNKSTDGFFIASEDLKLRGPGDLFGIRQSGDFRFKVGDIFQDSGILQMASEGVMELKKEDPGLVHPENALLKEKTEYFGNWLYSNLNL